MCGAMDFKILTLFSVLMAAEVLQQSMVLARIRPQITVPEEESPKACYNRQGEVGECVQNYLCDRTTGTIIEDGSDILDTRSQRSSSCIAPLVCCKPADNDDSVQVNSNVSIPMGLRHQRDVTVTRQGCGWRNENGVKDAPSGTPDGSAKPGEFPWMVSIMRREAKTSNDKSYAYVGSGFLINERAALAAAHVIALENVVSLYLVVGNYDGSNLLEKFLKKVDSFVLHEQFQEGIYVNDIAMIITKKPVKWLPHVGYICLPPLNAPVTPGSRCFTCGWGDNSEKVHQFVMGKVELPVMSRDACQTSLRTTALSPFFVLNESFMCAGGEVGKDTCKGGGGSPLACPIEGKPGRYMATGLLSWGMSCGLDGLPSVYIDVARQRQWIDDKMTQHGLTTASYTQY